MEPKLEIEQIEKVEQITIRGKKIWLYLFKGYMMESGIYNMGVVSAQIDFHNIGLANEVAIKNEIGFLRLNNLENYEEVFAVFFRAEIEELYNLDQWEDSVRIHRANRAYIEAKDRLKKAIKMFYGKA